MNPETRRETEYNWVHTHCSTFQGETTVYRTSTRIISSSKVYFHVPRLSRSAGLNSSSCGWNNHLAAGDDPRLESIENIVHFLERLGGDRRFHDPLI